MVRTATPDLLENDVNPAEPLPAAPVPPSNLELVAPHKEEIERLMPLAVFGL